MSTTLTTPTGDDLQRVIRQAIVCVNQGGLIAYPTEAVYGLGCDPDNEPALQRLLELKQRDPNKGLILISDDFCRLKPYLDYVEPTMAQRAFDSWPGPYTWLWPVRFGVSRLLHGQFDTLAVRVTDHPVVRDLCRYLGKPLVSTSANPAALVPAKSAQQVKQYFGNEVDMIVDAPLGDAIRPSEIRNVLTNQLIRA